MDIEEIGPPQGLAGLDFEKLDFPSDKLTVAHLRKRFPKDFEFSWKHKFDNQYALVGVLLALIEAERELAARLYAEAVGTTIPKDDHLAGIDTLNENLASDYEKLGLASGPHHADEMLRNLTAQVLKQASKRAKIRT